VKRDLENYMPGQIANGSSYRLATIAAMSSKPTSSKLRSKDTAERSRKRELPRCGGAAYQVASEICGRVWGQR
jgi:hypothetical protein